MRLAAQLVGSASAIPWLASLAFPPLGCSHSALSCIGAKAVMSRCDVDTRDLIAIAIQGQPLRPFATMRAIIVAAVLGASYGVTTTAAEAQDGRLAVVAVRHVVRRGGVDVHHAEAPRRWRCNTRVPLAELVALQPGWDRRDPDLIARRRWEVSVHRERGVFVASIESLEDGARVSLDEARDRTCGGLLDQVALNIARAVRTTSPAPRQEVLPEPPPPPREAGVPPLVHPDTQPAPPPQPEPPLPPASPAPAPTTRWTLALGGNGSVGKLPGPVSGGLSLALLLRRGAWSIGAEVAGERGADATVAAGETLQGDALGGAVCGCRHVGPVGLCGVVAGGALTLTRNLPATATAAAWSASVTTPWLSGGARVTAEWFPIDAFGVRGRLEGAARLIWPKALTELTDNLWTPEPLSLSAGVEAAIRW